MTNKLSRPLMSSQRLALEHSLLVAENEREIYDGIRARNLLAAKNRVLAIVRAEISRHGTRGALVYLTNGSMAAQDYRFRDAIVDLLWDREWGERPPEQRSSYFVFYEDLLAGPYAEVVKAPPPGLQPDSDKDPINDLNKLLDPDDLPSTQTNDLNTQELTMNNDITIVNQTLINGKPLSSYTDAQVYDLIAQAEKKIADLEGIKTKPARLKKEIADRRAALDALIKVLDEADPKSDLPAAIA